MSEVISATEARVHFGEVMRRATEQQQPVIVERDGKPAVVILSIAAYERLLAAQQEPPAWRVLVERARERIHADLGDRRLPPADEIVRQGREERDGHVDLR